MHAKPSGFVGGRADHGRIKGIHVDMHDFPHGHDAAILSPGRVPRNRTARVTSIAFLSIMVGGFAEPLVAKFPNAG